MRAPLSLLPLRLDNVVFEAGSRRIIDGISLTLERGPRTVVLGPNGAGKSVLLRLVPRPVAADRRVASSGIAPELPGGARRQAMVFQRPVMLRRSARRNVTYALKLAGVPARSASSARRSARQGRSRRHWATATPARSRAASSSASRWRGCGRCAPRSSFSTSRRRASTRAPRTRSRRSSSRCTRRERRS